MNKLLEVDWHAIFVPTESVIEVVVRGTIMFLMMYLLLRLFRKQRGATKIADLLVIVVIADAAQNGMAGDSKSVTEAILLILTIIFWDYFFDWLGFKLPRSENILEPEPLLVIKEGKLIRKNMQNEMITYDEIISQLRLQGIEKIADVKIAYLEPEGHFSFIKYEQEKTDHN